jgi:hypothetical protein
LPRQPPPETTPAPDIIARVGLASRPAEVLDLSADRVLFVTASPYHRGRETVIELTTADGALRRILPLRVTRSGPYGEKLYAVAGQFVRPLTPDELRALSCPRPAPARPAACLPGGVK